MASLRSIAIALLLTFGLLGTIAYAKSAGTLLQEGLYAEEVEGNLDSAIKIYQQIIADPSANRSHVAQALYRQGMCYMKKKDEQQAREVFGKLVQQYGDQTSLVEKVAPLLADLTNHDPAILMPPDTLAYIELGNPGRQIETILQMLKGTPFENPLAAIGGDRGQGPVGPGGKSPANIMAAMFNPSMMAEFKKIRGMAIGITAIKQNNPPMVAVLYPGKSDALRGLLLGFLNIVGRASAPTEGMQTLTIQNGPGVAYDDEVIIVAEPMERLSWCVKQYKGITNEPTLASQNKVFAKLSKEIRQTNALTVWVDASRTYSAVSAMMAQWGQTNQLNMIDGIADLKSIEDIITTLAIEQTGIALDASINFKENHNCLPYKMIQTPSLSRSGFIGVPSEAIAVASFALSESATSTDTAQKAFERLTGLSIGREIYANIEQVNIFVVPPKTLANEGDIIGQVTSCIGLALTSHSPQHTKQFLTQILGLVNLYAQQQGISNTEQQNSTEGRYVLPLGPNKQISFYLGQRDKTTILAFNPEVLNASLSAVENNKSALTAGPLQEPLNKLPADTSKIVLINDGGALRIVNSVINLGPRDAEGGPHQQLAQLAKSYDKTTIQLYTEEKPNNFNLHIGVDGLPPVNEVFGPIMQLTQSLQKAKAEAREKRRMKERGPADIKKASKAPVIDGTEEDAWSDARIYKLENVIYSPISSDKDFSAYYKAMWDEKNLYVLVDVTDDELANDSGSDRWYMDDCIEVFIDADNSKSGNFDENDYQYHFDWDKDSPTMDEDEHGKTDNVKFAMVTTDKGYRTEIKFPWSTLGTKPSAGVSIGFEVHVNDDDNGDRTKLAWWGKEDTAFGSPRTFGTARLVDLVGWWKFDEGSGTAAHDSSSRGNHGTLIGDTQWVADGLIGGALYFNDSKDTTCRVEIPTKGMTASAGTIALQAKLSPNPPSTEVFTRYFFGHTTTPYYNNRIQLYLDQTTMTLDLGLGDSHNRKMDIAPLDVEKWYHIALTWNDGNYVVYLDGQKLANGTYVGLDTLNTFANIGNDGGELDEAFDGTIDDVRIYNYALSQEEIEQLCSVISAKPQPADREVVGADGPAQLSWRPGIGAVSHKLYLGTDKERYFVDGWTTKKAEVDMSALSKAMPAIQKDKTYYWRVDDVQANGKIIKGNVWSFTTSGKLVGWWKLDETKGREVGDSSGNNHSGSIVGNPQWRPSGGKIGGALELDGDGDYVNLGKSPDFDLAEQITIAVWIKVNRFDKEWQAVIAKGDSAWRMQRVEQTNSLEFACSGLQVPGSAWGSIYGKTNVNDGQWHQATGVYDGKKLSLYIDGKLDVSVNAPGKINFNDYPVYIGENAEQTGRFWNGLIDDVRIYNYALGEGEIKSILQ
jgi:tetratricopeptide (TPR) repeat protein